MNWKVYLQKIKEGKVTPEDKKKLSEDSVIYSYLLKQWNDVSDTCGDSTAENRIWSRVAAKCWGPQERSSNRRSVWILRSAVAASIIFLIGWGSMLLMNEKSEISYKTICTQKGETLSFVLPDSSTVWLNEETILQYRENFLKGREIRLNGQAFFDVKPKKGFPFSVHFSDAEVEVKGTTFDIKSYSDSPTEIFLVTGRINFKSERNPQSISLYPNQRITYNTTDGIINYEKSITSSYDFRTGQFKFTDKRLDDLITTINEIYNVTILIEKESYNSYLFSGVLRKGEELSNIIEKLCLNLNLKYRNDGKTIILF